MLDKKKTEQKLIEAKKAAATELNLKKNAMKKHHKKKHPDETDVSNLQTKEDQEV